MSRTYARRLLAVWLAFVLALTLYPLGLVDLREAPRGWYWGWGHVRDHVLNLLLFVPLGWAARPAGWPWLVWLAFPLSLGIETVQSWLPARHSTYNDLILNTLGAVLGARYRAPKPSPRLSVALLAAGFAFAAGLARFERAMGKFGWTFTFGTALVGTLVAARFLRSWRAPALAAALSFLVAALQPWPIGWTTSATIIAGALLGAWPARR